MLRPAIDQHQARIGHSVERRTEAATQACEVLRPACRRDSPGPFGADFNRCRCSLPVPVTLVYNVARQGRGQARPKRCWAELRRSEIFIDNRSPNRHELRRSGISRSVGRPGICKPLMVRCDRSDVAPTELDTVFLCRCYGLRPSPEGVPGQPRMSGAHPYRAACCRRKSSRCPSAIFALAIIASTVSKPM
jgi:hypothetical protein